MESLFYYWDQNYTSAIIYNFLLLIALFSSLRIFAGVISGMSFNREILKRNNPAFGISISGISLALCIMLSGVLNIKPTATVEEATLVTLGYGLVGIVLMLTARVIFDDVSLPHISLKRKVAQGNIAAGILDAGNVLATALIIRVIMVWITDTSWESFLILFSAFVISQTVLALYTYVQKFSYQRKYRDKFDAQIMDEANVALAMRFTGKRIGAAFAIMAASHLLPYELEAAAPQLLLWAVLSCLMLFIMTISAFICEKIVLYKININHEVIINKNIAVGCMQAAIYISFGFLIAELLI